VNGCDLTPSTLTRSSEHEYSYLTARKRHPSTLYRTPATTPKAFHKESGHILSRGRQIMCIRLWHAPRIFSKISWRVEISVVLRARRNPTRCPPALFHFFALPFFNELAIHSSWKTKQRETPVVDAFTRVSLVVYGDDQFANLSVPFQNATATSHTRVSQTIRRSEFL